MNIGCAVREKQQNIYCKLIKLSINKKRTEKVNYRKLMEDAPVFKRHRGALRQVRHG